MNDYNYIGNNTENTSVDDMTGGRGKIDSVSRLTSKPKNGDIQFINQIDKRINDSKTFWDSAGEGGFNLSEKRKRNERYYYDDQLEGLSLTGKQTKYQENQLFIATDAVRSFLSANNVSPSVIPSGSSAIEKYVAINLEKALDGLARDVRLSEKLGQVILDCLLKHIGVVKIYFDPDEGEDGEICAQIISPNNLIVDKDAKQGENPAFIADRYKLSIDEIMHRWGKKNSKIKKTLETKKNRTDDDMYEITEVWFTAYDDKYEPKEYFAFYTKEVLLDYGLNPNYVYADKTKNFIKTPVKPYIPLNLTGDGQHWIDRYEPIEVAIPMQDILNKRGRQLMETVDRSVPLTAYNKSNLNDNDVDDIGTNPFEPIGLEVGTNGNISDAITRLPAPAVSPVLSQDKLDIRTQIHAIYGTPSEFTGASGGDNPVDPTLGQSEMKKQQAEGRLLQYQRAVDLFLTKCMQYMTQLISVYYSDIRSITYVNANGSYENIIIGRDNIKRGVKVQIENGSTTPLNDSRREALVQMFLDKGLLAPTDAYEMVKMPNSQKIYDNLQKFRNSPDDLVREDVDDENEIKAYIIFQNLLAGKEYEITGDETEGLMLAMRKFMIREEFSDAKNKIRKEYAKIISDCIINVNAAQIIDDLHKEGGINGLLPDVKPTVDMLISKMSSGLTSIPGQNQSQNQGQGQAPQQMPPQGAPSPQSPQQMLQMPPQGPQQ